MYEKLKNHCLFEIFMSTAFEIYANNFRDAGLRYKERLDKVSSTFLDSVLGHANSAERIGRNVRDLQEMTDTELTIRSCNAKGIDRHVDYDPVYTKIRAAMKTVHRPRRVNLNQAKNAWLTEARFRDRTMTQAEYAHIKGTSVRKLVQEWRS